MENIGFNDPPPRSSQRQAYLVLAVFVFVMFGTPGWAIWHIWHGKHEREAQIEKLLTGGKKIATAIVDVTEDRSIRQNGASPYRVYSEWTDPDTAKHYRFSSMRIWRNPLYRIGTQKTVTVYIDPQNPDIYFMDLTSLGIGAENPH